MMYQYSVLDYRVVDGDTVDLTLDLGFGLTRDDRFRLYGPDHAGPMGLDAPEMRTPAGKLAKAYLSEVMALGHQKEGLIAWTVKDRQEKYGRYLVVLVGRFSGQAYNVNALMVQTGHAVLKKY